MLVRAVLADSTLSLGGAASWLLTQSALEIDEAAMNVKSCLKVSNGFLYRTVSIKLGRVRIIY
jgi:hypothetical protein